LKEGLQMMSNLSIKNAFILVSLAVMVVLLGFSFFLINLINQLGAVTSDIVDHPFEVSNAASYANVEVLRMHRDLKEILLVEEAYEVNILVEKIRVAEAKVYVALDTIAFDILGDEGKEIQLEARALLDEWKFIRSEIIEAVRDGRPKDARSITRNKGADQIQSLEQKLIELNQYAIKKTESFQENSIHLATHEQRSKINLLLEDSNRSNDQLTSRQIKLEENQAEFCKLVITFKSDAFKLATFDNVIK